ncbi:P-loop ATPase, Sll1717 family [Tessaracoccus flavus]|uniref:P-loop ATPase, Sll1717 family n=1 Tax=Tessaracoccus flavus TaxID=1610493 RepID=UPI00089D8D9D|nr:hypothetical protein [Tessaracoccus flavus]SDY88183.1 hypothetical protein SAMN05428934_105178 [Tessaracoccus flavus]
MSAIDDFRAWDPRERERNARAFIARHQGEPGAFGDPDGGRADLRDFVDVEELRASAFFGRDAQRVRVVVGRKGSGKTIYLRRFQADLEANQSVVVAEAPTTTLITTDHVLRVAHWFPEGLLTETWQLCWGRAILVAAATYLLFSKKYRPYLTTEERESLNTDFGHLIRRAKAERSPFTTLKQLIDGAHSPQSLLAMVNNPLWDDLETRVAQHLRDAPPLYFIIDAIDEEYARAPAYWLRCQKGLFYETMRMLRHPSLGSRLHVVISIRDSVFHSIFQSEHASRYVGDPHVSILEWGYTAAKALLDAKTRRLPAELWGGTTRPESLSDWVGFSTVKNSYDTREPLYEYILRHAQCLPRDVVSFGNLLAQRLLELWAQGETLDNEHLRQVVSDVALISGKTQLTVVANHVVADEVPTEASKYHFVDSYLGVAEYKDSRLEQVTQLIQRCVYLRVGWPQILELQAEARALFGAPDLASVLWQAGLLGVEEEDDGLAHFFTMDRLGRLRLPRGLDRYVFHPSLREVCGLLPSGGPIYWRI